MQPSLLFLCGVQLLVYYVSAAPQAMSVYKSGTNEVGSTTYAYWRKFHTFTDLSKENVEAAWNLAERCYEWLEMTQPSPGVLGTDKTRARARIVAVTLFPGRDGGYSVGQNARGPAVDAARAEIRRDTQALAEAIESPANNQVHAEVLSWLVGETKIKPRITQVGREKHYPPGTITVVFGRWGTEFLVENEQVKLDNTGKAVLALGAPVTARRLTSCTTSDRYNNKSCREIAGALGVGITK